MSLGELFNLAMKTIWKHRVLLLQAIGVMALLATALMLALASTAARRAGDPQLSALLAAGALVLAAGAGWGSIPRLLRAVQFSKFFPTFSFQITKTGLYYIILVMIVALGAMNSGNNLLFLLLAVFLAIILVSGIFSRMNIGGIEVAVHFPEMACAGADVDLRVVLKNEKLFWPSYCVMVEGYRKSRRSNEKRKIKRNRILPSWFDSWNGEKWEKNIVVEGPAWIPVIPAGRSVSTPMRVRFLHRGRYSPGRFQLATRFPLGFFQKGIGVQTDGDFLVYPSISEENRLTTITFKAEGLRESTHRGWDGQFYSHRPYTSGDGVRYVDWKASAKIGELLIREYAREEQLRIHMILDSRFPGGEESAKDKIFEQMVSDAAGIAGWLVAQGAAVGLTCNENYHPPAKGEEAFHILMETLAIVERENSGIRTEEYSWEAAPDAWQRRFQNTEVIVFTAGPSAAFREMPFHWRLEYTLHDG